MYYVCVYTHIFLSKILPTSPISHMLALFGSGVNNVWKNPSARNPEVMGSLSNIDGVWHLHLCFWDESKEMPSHAWLETLSL